MNIAIVGCGYVGLVTGACFAALGNHVTCIDRDKGRIAALRQGTVPIHEPGLDDLIEEGVRDGLLAFSTDPADGIGQAEFVFVTVGTPALGDRGQVDLSHLVEAVVEISGRLDSGAVLVIKSTVPVGTCDEIEPLLRQLRPDLDCAVVSNPEFLREGTAIADFMKPDRIVIGTKGEMARQAILGLYQPFVLQDVPIVLTGRRTAELVKYAANAYLVARISFINEMADLCERIDADVQAVAAGIGLDHRIGTAFLKPGPGYGGSCFPKDTLALLRTAQEVSYPLRMVGAAVAVNSERKHTMARKIADACGGSVAGKVIAVLGLTFKPGTDDIRESPAIAIVHLLLQDGASIRAYDPQAMDRRSDLPCDVVAAETAYDCIKGADALVILTDWPEFAHLDLTLIGKLLRKPVVIDLRNVFSPCQAMAAGLFYSGIGRRADTDNAAPQRP